MSGPATRPVVLIVAQSARALAEAAVRAGYHPLTIDFFADDDTRAAAGRALRQPGGLRCGFRRARLMPLIEALVAASPSPPVGVVLGSGFEDRTRLMATIADRLPLIGTDPAAVQAVKDPFALAEACRDLAVPHPAVRTDVPDPEPAAWLVRRRAGTGGTHIRVATAAGPVPAGHVAMARVSGAPISAAVLADGRDARVLAFTRQSPAPTVDQPFRFAGVLGPVEPPPAVRTAVEGAAAALSRRFGLKGLVSLDLMVDADRWHLLEINPRPGASLDVLDAPAAAWADGEGGSAGPLFGTPLFAAHCEAAAGRLPPLSPPDATIRATLVVYAEADYPPVPVVRWPGWVLDRPAAGDRPPSGAPLATVAAAAPTIAIAERLLAMRAEALKELLRGNAP